jgi:hypothetical protein
MTAIEDTAMTAIEDTAMTIEDTASPIEDTSASASAIHIRMTGYDYGMI